MEKTKIRIEYNPVKYPEEITVKRWPDWIRKHTRPAGETAVRKVVFLWKPGIS